jgi:hypothetical protein
MIKRLFISLMRFLILLIIIPLVYTPAALSSDKPQDDLMVLIGTDNYEQLAGENINISITVKNQNKLPVEISTLRYRVLYSSLNMPLVKGDMMWERKLQPDETYSSSKAFSLPDYAPPGKYRIIADMISNDGNVSGSASSEITVKANYVGIAIAAGVFLLYALAVISLFSVIFYYSCSEARKE